MKLGEIVKQYRDENNITMDTFAIRAGLSKGYISMLEKDFNPSTQKPIAPSLEVIRKVATTINMDINDLIDILDDTEISLDDLELVPTTNYDIIQMPLYSEISCGNGMFTDDNIIEVISLPADMLKRNKDYFAQYAKGNSMIDENINDGDLLVFEKTAYIENGQIGCFCVDENIATCKKFYKDNESNIIMLHPANSEYHPIVVTVENMMFHIVGRLSLVINKR